jgi:YebC/PmpR family DNA-binding regulatory protein
MAIEKAKAANMPAANIQRAIDRVADKNAAVLEELTYEAMGPGGVGFIVEATTDNRNRTFPEIRSLLTKNGARMGDAGSVMFQFSRKGVIRVKDYSEDNLLVALDAGAEDAADEEGELVVYTDQKDLAKVRQNMIDNGLEIIEADLQYVPNNLVEVSEDETAEKIMKLMDLIDDHDDVVNVYTNADLK